jgi:Transposase DDE domain group 1
MLSASNLRYEIADRDRGLAVAGVGAMHRLAHHVGLVEDLNEHVEVLKAHLPYHESDHVLNIAYNALCGGQRLEDIELRRQDEVYLDALGAQRIPDPTTAGDFCRRFGRSGIESLQRAINESRLRVWRQQPRAFFEEAVIDADGTLVPTKGECKEGADFNYKGEWGYHVLVVSLANTQEPLFLDNRSGNRPSSEGAAARLDQAVALCRRAGFRRVTLRGDTDFSQTRHLDRWDEDWIRFVFGFDAHPTLIERAESLRKSAWMPLDRSSRRQQRAKARVRRDNYKEAKVIEREFENVRLDGEHVAEFAYSPAHCRKTYRMIVLRKNLTISKGEQRLFDEVRYFFYLTNDTAAPAWQIVHEANQRCRQEQLISQLHSGVRATSMPVDNLYSNWAYMVMAALAWSLKAWFALLLPEHGRWADRYRADKLAVLKMEFRSFINGFMRVPAQLVRTARRTIFRLLGWNRWQDVFLRGVDQLEGRLRC